MLSVLQFSSKRLFSQRENSKRELPSSQDIKLSKEHTGFKSTIWQTLKDGLRNIRQGLFLPETRTMRVLKNGKDCFCQSVVAKNKTFCFIGFPILPI